MAGWTLYRLAGACLRGMGLPFGRITALDIYTIPDRGAAGNLSPAGMSARVGQGASRSHCSSARSGPGMSMTGQHIGPVLEGGRFYSTATPPTTSGDRS